MAPDIEATAEQVFVALADPTRRAILATLAADGPATVGELAARLPITRQAIAKHLALMTDAGLVNPEPGERRRVRYRLRSAPVQGVAEAAQLVCRMEETSIFEFAQGASVIA